MEEISKRIKELVDKHGPTKVLAALDLMRSEPSTQADESLDDDGNEPGGPGSGPIPPTTPPVPPM